MGTETVTVPEIDVGSIVTMNLLKQRTKALPQKPPTPQLPTPSESSDYPESCSVDDEEEETNSY